MARPTKLTPELQTDICKLLIDGNFVETVCDSIGLSKVAFYDWMKRGERCWQSDIDGGYVEFSNAVKRAISQAERQMLGELKSGGMNWQAKAWWLERRHPDKWGNRQKIVHSGPDDGPIETRDVTELTDEQLARIAAISSGGTTKA